MIGILVIKMAGTLDLPVEEGALNSLTIAEV